MESPSSKTPNNGPGTNHGPGTNQAPGSKVTLSTIHNHEGQLIHSAPPRAGEDEEDDGLGRNRCGHASNHAIMLRVTITKTDLVDNIMYHDLKTGAFRRGEMLKASDNRAVFRFTDEDRAERFLVITGGPAAFNHEDLGVGKYAAKIRASGLDSIWADGKRIVDVAVEEGFPSTERPQ
ncbi:MAG: hypothetical protein P4L85_14100 [Paludisphaera borealis]|uniref:hypothetical protein n=1 Tax=Paludisphaera borealis TaxID=1387353 RepID=UPI002847FC0F|nr:hypothetical protein [Paludisphaera borealis]MDR3620479.1 hypothetical protein [Paludisphaera borealis]